MPDLGRWGAVDPLAVKSRHISVYGYANNSPFMFIDPTGEENMIYLVFILTNKFRINRSHAEEITRIAQKIIDKSGTNVKVTYEFRNKPYTGEELSLRDETDRTVFISDYQTLKKNFNDLSPEPGDSESERRIGVVDGGFFFEGYPGTENGNKELINYYEEQVGSLINGNAGDALAGIGRTSIHEVFHTLPEGMGHPDQGARRYGLLPGGFSNRISGDNMMVSRTNYERFPRENRPLLFSFLWQDKEILHKYYNKQTPQDNFTKRLRK